MLSIFTYFNKLPFACTLALVLAAGCQSQPQTATRGRERAKEEEAREALRPDRPDLAAAQDASLTRDPATGTVPRERLLSAKAQMDAQFKEQARAQQRGLAVGGSLSAASWTEKGPSNIGGRLLALMPDPSVSSGNTVWAGAAGGGLWQTTNATTATPTWTKVSDTFANLAVTALAYDPHSPGFNIMYFGTGEGFGNIDAVQGLGIWKSIDHGATWAQLSSTTGAAFSYVNKLVVDKNGVVYAATGTGLRRSTDFGATWTVVVGNGNAFGDVEVNNTTGAVYATLGPHTSGGGLYRSLTGAAGTFALLTSGLPPTNTTTRVDLALAPSNPAQMYALFCSGGGGSPAKTRNTLYGIYRSADGGTSWEALPTPVDADPGIGADFTRGQAWYDLAVSVSPTDPSTVFIGGVDLFKSSNASTATTPTATNVSWTQVTHWYGGTFAGTTYQYTHADQHDIEFFPGSGLRAYFANDGGFATTADATPAIPTITTGNTSLNVTQFYAVAMHPTNAAYFLAGAQDNGTQQFGVVGGTQTQDVIGGDGAFCFIDQDNPQYQFGSYVYNNISRSTNSGTSFSRIVSDNNGSFINPSDYDSNANALYSGYTTDNLRRVLSATGTIVSSNIALPAGSGNVTHVSVSPNVANRVYVGTDQGQVVRVDNANAASPTATTIFTGLANTSVSCVGVEALRPGSASPDAHILITIANYGVVSVHQTTTGTAATPTWASVEGNLPDMPVRWVLPDPTAGKRALLATELGVWSTDDLTATPVVWTASNTNLANVRVDMLRYRKGDRLVAAATHGRGLFTSNVFVVNPLPVELIAFSAQAAPGGAAVRLVWNTASEKNSARFEVERSTDGAVFERIGTVAAAGSSTEPRAYALLDAIPPAYQPLLYYRLRQVDVDGTAGYSPVRAVALAAKAGLALYPNPTRAATTLTGAAPGTAVQVFDAQGRCVASALADATGTAALPAGLMAGVYLVRVGTRTVRLAVE